jgi:hypothetical protein
MREIRNLDEKDYSNEKRNETRINQEQKNEYSRNSTNGGNYNYYATSVATSSEKEEYGLFINSAYYLSQVFVGSLFFLTVIYIFIGKFW